VHYLLRSGEAVTGMPPWLAVVGPGAWHPAAIVVIGPLLNKRFYAAPWEYLLGELWSWLSAVEKYRLLSNSTADQGTGCDGQQGFINPHGRQTIGNGINDSAADDGWNRTKNQYPQTSTDVHNDFPSCIGPKALHPLNPADAANGSRPVQPH
jgi:hypothetical protein